MIMIVSTSNDSQSEEGDDEEIKGVGISAVGGKLRQAIQKQHRTHSPHTHKCRQLLFGILPQMFFIHYLGTHS